MSTKKCWRNVSRFGGEQRMRLDPKIGKGMVQGWRGDCVDTELWPDGLSLTHLCLCLFLISGMGLSHFLCLLLCAVALTVSGVLGKDENSEVLGWTRQRLPVLLDTHTESLNTPLFRGQEDDEERGGTKTLCGIECQSRQPPMGQTEQERILGYETMYENGTHTHTDVSLQGFNKTSAGAPAHSPARTRRKRQIFGAQIHYYPTRSHGLCG